MKLLVELDPEDLKDAQDIGGNSGYKGRPASPVSRSPQKTEEIKGQASGKK